MGDVDGRRVREQALKGHLDILVLTLVEGGVRHGYGLIDALRSSSGGVLDLPEGTIYPLLHRLESRGLLESSWTSKGRRRREYALTRAGREALARQRAEWDLLSTAVDAIVSP